MASAVWIRVFHYLLFKRKFIYSVTNEYKYYCELICMYAYLLVLLRFINWQHFL